MTRGELIDTIVEEVGATEPLTEEFVDVALAMIEVFDNKQRDYGSGNIAAFGEFGVLVRVSDKVNRLRNLMQSGNIPNNEAIEDTWTDIATYAVIALMVRGGAWPTSS